MTRFEMKLPTVYNFYTVCVQVALTNFSANCGEVIFNFCQVGQKLDFGLPTNLVKGWVFIPDKLSGS